MAQTAQKSIQTAIDNQRTVIVYRQTELERPQVNWYWEKVKKIAAEEFKGMDLEVAFSPRYKIGGDDEGISVGATIPLYSKKEKLARKKSARSFLDDGAKLCAQLESALRKYLIQQTAYGNYEILAQDEGMDAFSKLVETQIKIVELEAEITQTHRQLQGLIAPFDDSVKILSWDKAGKAGK